MKESQSNLILQNFQKLMKECDFNSLNQKLIEKEVFSANEIQEIFSTDDNRHNKRQLFFKLMKKEQAAYYKLIDSLKETRQSNLAQLLDYTGATVFRSPKPEVQPPKNDQEFPQYSHSNPLNIKVIPSKVFNDTKDKNGSLLYYSTRSKNRGRVFIANNYDFNGLVHEYRKGAEEDDKNLKELFQQMGFEVELHVNLNAEVMYNKLADFAKFKSEKEYDICIVIIMSHGKEYENETIIYGVDDEFIYTKAIEELFNNENCTLYRKKPKVLIYQACRGVGVDFARTHADSASFVSKKYKATGTRTTEDMLICYSTLQGYIAHRDIYMGSWFIRLICEIFMTHAHELDLSDLFRMVDQRLSNLVSERRTVQTSEIINRGFKICYLNPMIYEENGVLIKKLYLPLQ